jgi:hypothetical protein
MTHFSKRAHRVASRIRRAMQARLLPDPTRKNPPRDQPLALRFTSGD